jgi:hypothetical protein
MVCAYVGEDGSATAFRAIARSILNFITGEEKRATEDTAGGLHSLTAATMKTDAKHRRSP